MADVNVNFVLGNDEPIRADFQLEPDVTYTAEIVTSTMSGNHPELFGRDLPDQHPMGAITGLEDALRELNTVDEQLEQAIADEATARQNADITLQENITAENNRAVEAEEALDNKIDSEADTRADEITRVEGLISDEETRAKSVEQDLRDDLTAEVNRATNAEGVLQTNITAETNRATSAEDTLQANITAEENRAKGVETSLQANITAEENRAKGVEQQLSSSIDSNHQAISNHVSDKNNPHEVTKAQVGLGNVENIAPADMPMSTATKTYVDNADDGLQGQITIINTTIGGYGNIVTHNVSEFATASQGALANTALQPNDNISELTNNLNYQTATQVANSIAVETNNRESADNNLQSQIDAIVSASDVFDIVGTYAELQAYDISTVPVNDIIKVLVDSTHAGAATYYRCVETGNVKSWSYIGSEGAYYTKAEADSNFVPQTRTVNNKALSSNIILTATDVGALPSSTVIPTVNDGQLDIQVNGSSIATFTANQSGNTTADITIPDSLPDQTGNAGKFLSTDGTDASWQYGINYRGTYNATTQYYPGDVVQYYYDNASRSYLCIQPTLGNTPDVQSNSYWKPFDTPSQIRVQNDWGDKPILPFMRSGSSGSTITGVWLTPGTTSTINNFPTINTSTGLLKAPNGIDGYSPTSAFGAVAFSNDYGDLDNKPSIPTATSELTNDSGFITVSALSGYATESWVTNKGYITGISSSDVTTALGYTPYDSSNPAGYITSSALAPYALSSSLSAVATSGAYADLSGKPNYGAGLSYSSSSLQLLDQNGNNLGSAVTIKSTPDLDGVTIDTNSDDELEAIGTVNKNTAVGATAVKYDWIGTLAEYNSQNVETLHPEWICFITDDVSGGTSVYTKTEVDNAISTALTTMLDSAFPVGSRYITEASTCPLATLIPNSTWVLTSQGRVLQGADSNHASGTTAEAGVPNISGHFIFSDNIVKNTQDAQYVGEMVGCFTGESVTANTCSISGVTVATVSSNNRKIKFSAGSSNSIYGNSTTVQPPAEFVNIFKRTA